MTNVLRVFIADDQDMIVQGLRFIVDAQPDMEVVGTANSGDKALALLMANNDTDVALLDIRMPERTGIEVAASLTAPHTKVVLLTTFDHAEYIAAGIRSGAVGFLLKDAPTEELLDAIRRAARGEVFYRTEHAKSVIAEFGQQVGAEQQSDVELLEGLTDRELEVLQFMAYGMRNQDIAGEMNVTLGTVKTHVHRILQKLQVEDRTQAVVYAIRNQLVK